MQIHRLRVSEIRLIHGEPLPLAESEVLAIFCNSHNELGPGTRQVAFDCVTHRVHFAEHGPRQGFVNDDDRLGAFPIRGRKLPAAQNRSADGVKVIRTDIVTFIRHLKRRGGDVGSESRSDHAIIIQGNTPGNRNRIHTRQNPQLLQRRMHNRQLLVLAGVSVAFRDEPHISPYRMVDIEAGIR